MRELLERTFSSGNAVMPDLLRLLDCIPVALAIGVFPEQHIRFVNRAFTRMFGYENGRFTTIAQWLDHAYETDAERELIANRRAILWNDTDDLLEIGPHEYRVRCADGSFRTTLNRETILRTAGIGMTTFEDISEHKRNEERMRQQSLHDPLTGLPNRRGLNERWKGTGYHRSLAAMTAVLMIDLDGFKPVNDRFGHGAGDMVLQEAARRLQAAVRESDFVSRIGGDEFVILLDHLHDTGQVAAVCDRVVESFRVPFEVPGGSVEVNASIGVSLLVESDKELADVVRAADQALYRRKSARRDGWEWSDATAALTIPSG